jgi:hypothetical protein
MLTCSLLALAALTLALAPAASAAPHAIELNERLLTPEDGLLLGNGDLSVSVYQTADRIVWRFGKGDVWDRRIDRSDDPKPAHIDEVARGITDEGWKCPPYGGPVEATRGTKNPARMKDICQAVPPSYRERPYPCPKPVGELALQLPADQPGLRIRQRLVIEEGRVEIDCTWRSGVALRLDCCIPPSANVLLVRWKVTGWKPEVRTGNSLPPIWFSLYRWADPTIQEFGARFIGEARHGAFSGFPAAKCSPLPKPALRLEEGLRIVDQPFPADPTYPSGFHCMMAPMAAGVAVEPADTAASGEARLHIMPGVEAAAGTLAVAVATGEEKAALASLKAIRATGAETEKAAAAWEAENRTASAAFWAKSGITVADPLIEGLWYETLHARRCTNRPDCYPPGLFLPSTVQDYSHWHGDYHTNYDLQEPFWGDYTANHLEVGDAYFAAMKPILDVGRKIARDYYGARGSFVQLTGYPAVMEDDPLGCVPMGRMAYMTGWVISQYWWRYQVTLDEAWLRTTGYPAIRDCALFYTDFMKKGADGLYHTFPSNQGEDGFSGNPKDFTDRPQVMEFARHCLRTAIRASEALKADPELRAAWQDRLDHCAGDDGNPPRVLTGEEKRCYEANAPEFGFGRPYKPQPATHDGKPWPNVGDGSHSWYYGQYPWGVMGRLRGGEFIADRDFPVFRALAERWRHPNGLIWAMSVGSYGHSGAWTESLGVLAPLQEMMLQSWDGALRIFPAWPRTLDASFRTLRANGAFLVSASWAKGAVTTAEVISEKGGPCRAYAPWPKVRVTDGAGKPIRATQADGVVTFATTPGGRYAMGPG